MLPFGAGFGPPLLGLILGAAATRLHADYGWTRTHIPEGVRRALSRVWPWAYGAAIAAWLFLMPGVNLIDYFVGVGDPMSMMGFAFFSAMGTLLAAIVTGYARDSLNPALPPERSARLKPVLHKS
jgi:hypothetical protein